MSDSLIKNIMTGVRYRLSILLQKSHPATLSKWKQVKIKHSNSLSVKSLKASGLYLHYKVNIVYTYADIFVREIYRFNARTDHPLIIDCGANIGLSVLYFKKYFSGATVIAFEPDEENFHLLQQNVKDNCFDNKVELLKKAVWINNDGVYFLANGTEGSRIVENNVSNQQVHVETIRLKDTLIKYTVVDFLKIDIEGAEYDVLRDCADNLSHVQNLFIEYHGLASETYKLKELLNIMDNAGFSVYITTAADYIRHPFTDKKSKTDFDVQLNLFGYRN